MEPLNIIESLSALGLGAVIAVLVLYWKRADDKRYSTSIERLLERRDEQSRIMLDVIKQNTAAVEAMTSTIDALISADKIADKLRDLETALHNLKGQ